MSQATSTSYQIRTVTATRYVTPLREGGSLPAVMEADDDGLYVVKFRGAGQGAKALVAELVAGEIGRALGLLVPEIALVEVDPALGRSEPDSEIQALLKASAGLNLAVDYLPGALPFDPAVARHVDPALASDIVWFDAYVTNVDRTPRNTNLLVWHRRLWLIDHGAALYFHHAPSAFPHGSSLKFARIRDHVLLPYASELERADVQAHERLHPDLLAAIVGAIPEAWLDTSASAASIQEQRAAYVTYLTERLEASRVFVKEAEHVRTQLV